MKKSTARSFERYSGRSLLILLTLIPAVFWLIYNPLNEIFASPQSFFFALGKLLSLIGFTLFALNLVLATRTKWLEKMFGGLNEVYKLHHYVGGLALSFLAFHPMLLAVSYIYLSDFATSIKSAAQFLLPKAIVFSGPTSDLQQNVAFNAGSVAFFGMVVLLVLTFFVRLPYQVWLFTHKFLGVAFLLACVHTLMISSDASRHEILFYYMLFISILGLSAYIYRTIMGNVLVRRIKFKVTKIGVVAGNVVQVELEPLDKVISFSPGQFVFVRFLKDSNVFISGESHPFSMASAPSENGLRFYIKSSGDYTKTLEKLQIGQIAEVEGAFGRFSYTNFPDKSQIWIAGGIGVTPFISMARSLKPGGPNIDMYYTVVKRSELIEQTTLAEFLPANYPNFKYHSYVFDETKTYLSAELIKNQVGDLSGKEIFICGPKSMMRSLRSQFRQLGVPNRQIHSEEFDLG